MHYRPTDGRIDGRIDRPTDRRMDRPSYRDARTHLKTHSKNFQKLLKISINKKKKHISLYKSSNILDESYVKPCGESNGTTPGFENWFNEKICPKN